MSEPRDAATPLRERHPLIAETWLAVGFTLALLFVGTVANLLFLAEALSLPAALAHLVASLGWRSLVWALLTIAIAALLRHASRRLRMALSVLAAALAVTVSTALRFGVGFASAGVLATGSWIVEFGAFLICVLLGWLLAIRVLDSPPGSRAATFAPAATVTLIVIGGAGILALLHQWLRLYFRIWSTSSPVYEDFGPEGIRYLVTAGVSATALLGGVILARVRALRGMAALGIVLLVVFLVVAVLFQVPAGRFFPDNEPITHELPENYSPCYSGSDSSECRGG